MTTRYAMCRPHSGVEEYEEGSWVTYADHIRDVYELVDALKTACDAIELMVGGSIMIRGVTQWRGLIAKHSKEGQ
jgi:hypothetical protein